MKDRFKFRAYNTFLNLYWNLCEKDSDGVSVSWVSIDNTGVYLNERLNYPKNDLVEITDITEETKIELCTGLKDVNGNLIYEGDILSVELGDYTEFGKNNKNTLWTIDYKNFNSSMGFRAYGKNRRFNTPLTHSSIYNHKALVVGNINENKEMLK